MFPALQVPESAKWSIDDIIEGISGCFTEQNALEASWFEFAAYICDLTLWNNGGGVCNIEPK